MATVTGGHMVRSDLFFVEGPFQRCTNTASDTVKDMQTLLVTI